MTPTPVPSPTLIETVATATSIPWTEVLTALGTVGAVAVALVFGLWQMRYIRRDAKQRDENRKREQASKVTAWLETGGTSPVGQDVRIRITNTSDRPVFNFVLDIEDDYLLEAINMLPDSSGAFINKALVGILPPNAGDVWWSGNVPPEDDRPIPCSFTDAEGIKWRRDAEGLLVLVGD